MDSLVRSFGGFRYGQVDSGEDWTKRFEAGEAEQRLKRHYAGARILLAEDNEINREVVVSLLQSVDLNVDVAINGREAVSMGCAGDYDLILMDIQMPEKDGMEATRLIRTKLADCAGNIDIPILAMTANVFEEDRLACLRAGMDGFVGKPVEPEKLFAELAEWLPGPQNIDPEECTSADVTDVAVPDDPAIATQTALPPIIERGVDPEALRRVLGEDRTVLSSILQEFVSQTELIFDEIQSAHGQHDAKQLAFHAHKLKSSARTVGANHLADLCIALETAGHSDDWTSVGDVVADMPPTIDCIREYVIAF
jgi:CheY-like chemotaxis protein/HPt (histidine-containing phosphotransfer) domain-containing protein